ncbi:MAG: sugar ABC transporter permease [Clostridiales bacterium]|nr:sugar ABC transporter permease [Clostridiales bacterium]
MAKTSTKNQWKAWLYLLPALVILAVFTVWPIINTVRMSMLKDYNGLAMIGGKTFEFGFDNFKSVVEYEGFANALGNTLLLCVITVPISTMLALLIAVALNSIKFIRKAMQTIFFLPYVTNSIAIGMVFMAMFSMIGGSATLEPDSVGLINNLIVACGGKAINWVNMGSSKFANMAVLVIYIVWNALPFKILVLLGGLQGVNKQYYDAAKIDGTSRFRTFWRITVPLLSPMIAYVVITGFIGGFKEYSSVVGIFGETMGPTGTDATNNMNTMVGYIFDSLKENNQGGASAAALILFAIIFAVTMVNMYVSKKKVHY